MMEESTTFFKDSIVAQDSNLSASLLKVHQSGIQIDATLTQIQMHDDEEFHHLALSYVNSTLSFQMLQTYKNASEPTKYIQSNQIDISKEFQNTISSLCDNQEIKQLKMSRLDLFTGDPDDIFDEPVSPKFASASPISYTSVSQHYLATLVQENNIIAVSFTVHTNKKKGVFTHRLSSLFIKQIPIEGGRVNEVFLHKRMYQIIATVSEADSTKINFIDEVMGNHKIINIATFARDSEKIIGSIGVSSEFTPIRAIIKSEKEKKRFYINTYYINSSYFRSIPFNINDNNNNALNFEQNIPPQSIIQNFQQKPFHSIMNETNYNSCNILFSERTSFLSIYDGFNIEVYDFNNINSKNIIKEFVPKSSGNNLSQQLIKPQKLMYNLDKSTTLIANSSVNQFISLYNLSNPISILDQINNHNPSEYKQIKSVIISSNHEDGGTPSSATNLMEMNICLKQQMNAHLILVLAILEDNSVVPYIINKETLDLKVPELKFVNSQITSYQNNDDSQNLNDFEFPRMFKNFDVFKTPDRKASFTFLNSSIENNKIHFSIPQNFNSQASNNYQIMSYPFNQQQQRQGKCLNFDNLGSQRERERSMSQESNNSRNFSAYKASVYGPYLIPNNKKTLFNNENSNSICMDDFILQMQKTTSGKKDTQSNSQVVDPSLFDKISPTQQKIDEAQNSSDSQECCQIKTKRSQQHQLDYYADSPLSTSSKNQNRYFRGGQNSKKDISRIALKKQYTSICEDNIPPTNIFQKTEVSQEDIINTSFSQIMNGGSNNFIAVHSQTQEDIENSFSNILQQSLLKDDTQEQQKVGDSLSSKFKIECQTNNNNSIALLKKNSFNNETNDCLNDDISNIQSQEIMYQYQLEELEQTVSSKKSSNSRNNNNIFNKQISTPTTKTVQCGPKSKKASIQSQKQISSYWHNAPPSSHSPSYPMQKGISHASNNSSIPQKDIFNSKCTQSSNSSSSHKSSSGLINEIKPFNSYTQTKLFTNEKKPTTATSKNPSHMIRKQFIDEIPSHHQIPFFNQNPHVNNPQYPNNYKNNSSNNNNNNNNNLINSNLNNFQFNKTRMEITQQQPQQLFLQQQFPIPPNLMQHTLEISSLLVKRKCQTSQQKQQQQQQHQQQPQQLPYFGGSSNISYYEDPRKMIHKQD